ncbi:hypothetical protein [Paenibacillus alkalitolerans]|uniref:hypothetical protein n=1 Tax=Paenibacillus alkalitolerans TaxID=2799335 RepID=UPI0018F7983B|nr:hypothetical protein [Paenibacillus alkalitolerans]
MGVSVIATLHLMVGLPCSGNIFRIPETMLKEWITIFEPPAEDELQYTCVY